MTSPLGTFRLAPNERLAITRVSELRSKARALRSQVAQGSYGDEELRTFWELADSASVTLHIANPELSTRAGLGDNFFVSVVRERRRPKLTNFLKALSVIIEVADERLLEVDSQTRRSTVSPSPDRIASASRIEDDWPQLLSLARTLGRIARQEIEKLENERPNDPARVDQNLKERDLLEIFAQGFDRIATALSTLDHSQDPSSFSKARAVVAGLGKQVNNWWHDNAPAAVDWSLRIPVFAAGVAVLGWAGANMTIATSAIAALVGGPKVLEAIGKARARK